MSAEAPRYSGTEGVDPHLETLWHNHLAILWQGIEGKRVAQRKIELDKRRATAKEEANEILNEFRVEERLRHIQENVWGGAGEIRTVETKLGTYSMGFVTSDEKYDKLGGLELVHQYPFFKLVERDITIIIGHEWPAEWRYNSKVGSTSLSIVVFKKRISGVGEKVLVIHSKGEIGQRRVGIRVGGHFDAYFNDTHNFLNATIPIAVQDSRALLDSTLVQETTHRLTNDLLPSQLEENARGILAEMKQKPGWLQWTLNSGWNDL